MLVQTSYRILLVHFSLLYHYLSYLLQLLITHKVIYNLINNAINYTGKDKTVTVRVTKHKKYYLVEIIDTGKGIKESEIPYIWNKYYKNDKNHQRNVVSTGLGLSIVKEILELHGYEYGVKSVLKKGSTFYFKIKI